MAEIKTYTALAMDRSEPIGNSDDGTQRRALHVLNRAQLVSVAYDSGTVTYPDSVTEVYQFKIGGVSGTTIATVTVIYTDATKANLLSWSRT